MSFASGSIASTGAANGVSVATQKSSSFGPDGTAAVVVGATFTGATLVVEGILPGGSKWFPLGGYNPRTGAAIDGAGIALTNSTAASFRFPGVDVCDQVRAYLSALGSGAVDVEIGTQPAAFGTAVATPLATAIASTPQAIASTSANALAVGANGATNPVLNVNAATGSVATGIQVTGAAAAGGVALAAISSGTNESLTIDAKGSGTITLNGTGTGNIVLGRAATGVSLAVTGALTSSGTAGVGYATGAGGAVTQLTSRTTGVTLNKTTGAITLVSAAGSATPATFTVTNSTVAATDTVLVSQRSGTDLYDIAVTAVGAGSFNITFNTTGGTTTEQPVFNFAVLKGVAA